MSHMKRIGILFVVLLTLTACGSSAVSVEGEQNEISGETERMEITDDYAEDALPVTQQLALGSLLLEETDLAVDPDQALDLVPYWKLYKSLLESDTTAPEELDALVNEIQEIMTADQVNYIAGLQLTQEDMTTLAEELGIVDQMRPEGMEEGAAAGQGGLGGGLGGGGGMSEEGIPGEGEATMDPELMATKQAEREAVGGEQSSRMTIPLLEALISLLEGKVGN